MRSTLVDTSTLSPRECGHGVQILGPQERAVLGSLEIIELAGKGYGAKARLSGSKFMVPPLHDCVALAKWVDFMGLSFPIYNTIRPKAKDGGEDYMVAHGKRGETCLPCRKCFVAVCYVF